MKSDVTIKFGDFILTDYMDLIDSPDFSLMPLPKPGESKEKSFNFKFLIETKDQVTVRDKIALGLFQGKEDKLKISFFPNRYWLAEVDEESSYIRSMEHRLDIEFNLIFNLKNIYAETDYIKIFPAVLDSNKILQSTIVNEGTVSVPITYRIKHTSKNGYLGVVSRHGTGQIGSVSEAKESEMVIGDTASDGTLLMRWTEGGGRLTENFPTTGTWTTKYFSNRAFMAVNAYGLGNGWHGASKTRKLSADSSGEVGAKNFTLDLRLWFLNYAGNQQGLMECIISTADGKRFLGIAVDKGTDGNQAKIRLYNGETNAHIDIDTGANDFVSENTGRIIIEKFGNKVTFRFNNRTVSYVVTTLKDTVFTDVTLFAGQMSARPVLNIMGFQHVFFHKHYTDNPTQVPNKFQKNDEVIVEGDSAKIYHNSVAIADVVGSDWFLAPPGETKVQFYYSSFATAPEIKAEIKEAWL
ncbi:hypothetical protein [Enterococcus alishanensis]